MFEFDIIQKTVFLLQFYFTNRNRSNGNQLMIKVVLTVIIILYFVQCKLQLAQNLYPFSANIAAWDIANTHMVIFKNLTFGSIEFYDFSTSTLSTYAWPLLLGVTTIITHQSNTNTSFCFALFTSITIQRAALNNSLCANASTIDITGRIIRSTGFGKDVTQLYAADQTPINSTFLSWMRNGIVYSANYTSNYLAKFQLYHNNSVFYVFINKTTNRSHSLAVYSTYSAGQPNFYNQYQYFNCSLMTISLLETYLVVNCGSFADVRLSYVPFTSLLNITFSFLVQDIAILSTSTFVAKSSAGLMAQYSLADGALMDIRGFTMSSPHYLRRVDANKAYLFNRAGAGILFSFSQTIVCQGPCNCTSPYSLSGLECVLVVNNTNYSTPSNSSIISGNINTPIYVMPNSNLSSVNQTLQQSSNAVSLWRQDLRVASLIIGNTFAVASARLLMKSNIPLSLWMEQFWLYKYYIVVQYPEIMTIFMQEFEFINLLKLQPTFMGFLSSNYSILNSLYYADQYRTPFITYRQNYFAQSAKQFYTFTILLNFSIFFVFKLLSLLFRKIDRIKKSLIIKMVYDSLQERSQWWGLFMIIIEADFLALCFYCLNQIALPFAFAFENKANLLASLIVFFVLTVYGTVGYALMNRHCRKFSTKLLVFCKYANESVWLESGLTFTLNLCKSFAHSAVITDTLVKFVMLALIDVCFIVLIISARRLFFNKVHFTVYLIYQIAVLIVNFFLFLKMLLFQGSQCQFDFIVEYNVLSLLLTALIKLSLSLVKSFGQTYRFYTKNRIKPQITQSRKPQKCASRKDTKKSDNTILNQKQNKEYNKTDKMKLFDRPESAANKNKSLIPKPHKNNLVVRIKTMLKKQQNYPKKSNFANTNVRQNNQNNH